MTSGGNGINHFPESQLTKFRVVSRPPCLNIILGNGIPQKRPPPRSLSTTPLEIMQQVTLWSTSINEQEQSETQPSAKAVLIMVIVCLPRLQTETNNVP